MKLSISEKRLRGYNRCTSQEHLEYYSHFLKDGDYEQYMDYINGNYDKRDLIIIQRQLVRLLWIRNRFTEYSSTDCNHYATQTNAEYNKLLNLETKILS